MFGRLETGGVGVERLARNMAVPGRPRKHADTLAGKNAESSPQAS